RLADGGVRFFGRNAKTQGTPILLEAQEGTNQTSFSVDVDRDGRNDSLVFEAGRISAVRSPFGGATFVVNSPAEPGDGLCDDRECTLREAIAASNARPGLDRILFRIPGTGPQRIVLQEALPPVTDPVLIDAGSQPGFDGTPLIEIDGSQAGGDGVRLTAGSSTIR